MPRERLHHPTGDDWARGSYFFISYSHVDIAYVKRLVAHLESFGLPTWYDSRLDWGAQFTASIRQHLRNALAVIAVMSPAAEESDWVSREILEAQCHDREFLPILLDGSRFFLLATRNYFDARNGSLPGSREILQLQAIRDERVAGAKARSRVVLRPPCQPTSSTHPASADSVRKLQDLLGAGELGHADILTTSVLLESVRRLEAGWLRRRADGTRLSSDLLNDIDASWSKFSGGAHGFRTQLGRYPGPPIGVPAGGERDFTGLAQALGWKKNRRDTSPPYGALIGTSERPSGFFPTLRNPQTEGYPSWHDQWVETVMGIHLQLRGRGGLQ